MYYRTKTNSKGVTRYEVVDKYNLDSKIIEFSLDDFRDKLGLKSTYTPRHITANIIPKLKKDLSKYYKSFDISYLREGKQKVVGYRLTWWIQNLGACLVPNKK